MVLEFLLRHHARTGDADALEMVDAHAARRWPAAASTTSSPAASRATPSTPPGWCRTSRRCSTTTPSCCGSTRTWWRATGSPLAERVARETADFLLRDLRHGGGRLRLARSTPTPTGVEGLTYAWTPAQLDEVLGADDGARGRGAASGSPTTAPSSTAPRRCSCRVDPDDPALVGTTSARGCSPPAPRRPQPGRDDKVVTAWNGLAIAALAEAGALLGEPRLRRGRRRACADFVARRRTSSTAGCGGPPATGSVGHAAGVADDYGDLAEGLLALHQATGEPRWLDAAGDLLDAAPRTSPPTTAASTTPPTTPSRCSPARAAPADNAEPSGTSALAGALLTLRRAHRLDPAPRRRRRRRCDAAGAWPPQNPRFAGWALAVAEARVAGPLQVAVVGPGGDADALAGRGAPPHVPGSSSCAGEPDATGIPLLAGPPARGRRARGLRLPGVRLRAADDRPRRAASSSCGDGAFATLLKPRTAQ